MNYQGTIRYGKKVQQYLSLSVEAPNVPAALQLVASHIASEMAQEEVDLVELREAPDFDKRMEESHPEEADGGSEEGSDDAPS
jgi:hypothetical protein